MAHTLDTKARLPSTANTTTTANPAETGYICGAGATVLTVAIIYSTNTNRTGGAPTYNGVALTQADTVRRAPSGAESSAELWYLLAPPTGATYTVSVPNTAAKAMDIVISSYSAQAGSISAFDVAGGAGATSASPASSVVATEGDAVIAVVASGAQAWTGASYGGQIGTVLYNNDNGSWGGGSQYLVTGESGTQQMSWTFSTSDDWGLVIAAFKETHTVNVHEDVAITDMPTALPETTTRTVNTTQSVALTEAVTSSILDEASASENITVTDTPVVQIYDFSIEVHEDITVTDIPHYYQDLIIVTEHIEVSVESLFDYEVNVHDDITLTVNDFHGGAISGVNVNESVTVTESHSVLIGAPAVNKSEAVTVTESYTVTRQAIVGFAINVHEDIIVSWSVEQIISTPAASVEDNIELTEAVTGEVSEQLPNIFSVHDDIAVTESNAATVSDPQVTKTQSITLTESVTVVRQPIPTLSINATQNIAVTWSIGQTASSPQISKSESINLSEAVEVGILGVTTLGLVVSDTIHLTENKSSNCPLTGISVHEDIVASDVHIVGFFVVVVIALAKFHGKEQKYVLHGPAQRYVLHGRETEFSWKGKSGK